MGRKQKLKAALPFFLVGLTAVLWHLTIKVSFGDDLTYFGTLMDGRSIWEILAHRYQTWSSRLAIELVLIPLVKHTLLWKLLDILIFTTIPIMLCRLADADEKQRWFAVFLVLLYPFGDMVSAGWISTTTNYLWPLWCILWIGCLIKKIFCGGKIRWYEAAGGAAACIYGSSQEQVAVILFVVLVLSVIFLWKGKHKKIPLIYLLGTINIVSLASILLCPGNGIRRMQEVSGRMPKFAGFSVWEKLYLGLVNVERIFIANVNGLFLTAAAVLAALVYIKTKSWGKTLISGLPLMVLAGYSVIKLGYPPFEKIFAVPEQAVQWDWKSPFTYLPLLFLAVSAGGILYALYVLMKENMAEYVCIVLLLGAGLASGAVMGFSPTVYASADRPYIYLYFIIIYTCLLAVKRIDGRIWDGIHVSGLRLLLTAPALLAMVNVIHVWWICYIMRKM